MKVAILFRGESFRTGGQSSRLNGTQQGFKFQEEATQSHIRNVIQPLEHRGYQVDVYLNTYVTEFNENLKQWYAPWLKGCEMHPPSSKLQMDLLFEGYNSIPTNEYVGVLMLRFDIFFKVNIFTMSDFVNNPRFLYASRISAKFMESEPNGSPRINDVFFWAHKEVSEDFKRLISSNRLTRVAGHDWWHKMAHLIPEDRMGYFTAQQFDSDSAKEWNPFYRLVSRQEANP